MDKNKNIIRTIAPADSSAFLALRERIDGESAFLMREPDEDRVVAATMEHRIRSILAAENHTILVCSRDTQLIGYLHAAGGAYRRNRGVVRFSMAVLADYQRMGVAGALVDEFEVWAELAGIHRLEMQASRDNVASLSLFKKRGYRREGVHKHAVQIDGQFVDKITMAKIFAA